MSAAVLHDSLGMDLSVQWLGTGAVPHAVATSLLTRGVRLAEGEQHTVPPGRLTVVDERGLRPRANAKRDLRGRRVLVLHSDPEHANLLSWALSARGALTRTFDPAALDASAAFDADVVLVDHTEAFHACWDDLCAIWRHARLRWTPCVLLSWAQLENGSEAELDAVCLTVQRLCTEFDSYAALAGNAQPFQLPFGSLGPARALRAVLDHAAARELLFATPRVTIEVHVSDHMILGARGRFSDGSSIELRGARALACLIAEEVGTMQAFPRPASPLTNVMASFDEALVRGPDGAWLSESVVATLPSFPELGESCGFEDETLFARRNPAASGVCERVTHASEAPTSFQSVDDVTRGVLDDGDDGESKIPTRKLVIATLLEEVEQPRGQQAARPVTEPAAVQRATFAVGRSPLRAASKPPASVHAPARLRGVELADERPSEIRVVRRARPSGVFARLLALGMLVVGVLCVDSDRLAVERTLVQGILSVESWIPVTLRLDSRPSRIRVAVPNAATKSARPE